VFVSNRSGSGLGRGLDDVFESAPRARRPTWTRAFDAQEGPLWIARVSGRLRFFSRAPVRGYARPVHHATRPAPAVATLLAAALALVLAACSDVSGAAQQAGLPHDWSRAHSARFERLLDEHLPLGSSTALAPADLAQLRDGLAAQPAIATRAALWLARAHHPDASEVLLARLEERHAGADRAADVGDATGAAALGRAPLARDTLPRLRALAVGDAPHPDLEVRVECALAVLAAGDRSVVPLLLRVLRIDTPSEAREGALTDSPTTNWARGRADLALTALAGKDYRDRTDAPYAEREAWADELEALLLAPR
jgi:hypothetical protein